MTTRLDRLFLLLDTGSTPSIRKSAAEQLGEVQKLHPYELNNLLSKVHSYLRSSNWETRIAAGQAVESIGKNVPQWEPRGAPKSELGSSTIQEAGTILFSQFDVNKVLAYGASLLGSEGVQYDVVQTSIGLDDRDRLAQQRQLLNKRLGLDIAGNLGIESDNLFNDEDLFIENSNGQIHNQAVHSKPVADLVKQQLMDVTRGLSAREKNKAKRKARSVSKQVSRDGQLECNVEIDPPAAKKTKQEPNGAEKIQSDISDNTLNLDEIDEWPFESFCEVLMNDLFNSSWEIRHGAATGLREVVKLHGRGASKSSDTPSDQMSAVNQIWLCDLSIRLLCVLVLDRFGDFVSDEVVAPVRETCSQNLGVVLKFLDVEGVNGVTSVLLQLLSQNQWEIRHGGLLGIKYLFAVRQDLTDSLLPVVLPAIFQGLKDPADDVRAVAAAALIPVSNKINILMPEQTPVIINCLWDTLVDLDDLTASTNSIMILLSTLISTSNNFTSSMSQTLSELTPRLWPFLRHNIVSVRKATLQTFCTLLNTYNSETKKCSWLCNILPDALRLIYQRCLLENNEEILQQVFKVWSLLLERSPLDYLIAASMPWLGVWLCLIMQPSKTPFEPTYLIDVKHKSQDTTGVKSRNEESSVYTGDKEEREYIGGIESINKSPIERDRDVMRSRMAGTRLLGSLAGYITQTVPNYPTEAETPVDSLTKLFIFHLNTKSALQRYVIGQVLYQWALNTENCLCSKDVKTKLLECLSEAIYFDEIALAFTRMQSDCRDFVASIKQQGINMDAVYPPASILTLDQAGKLTTTCFDELKKSLKPKMLQVLDDRRKQLHISVTQTTLEQQTLTVRVLCSLAMASVVLTTFPEKLNPVIRPLMECIKKEENCSIQEEASKCLAKLIEYVLDKTPNPTSKIIKNISTYLSCDTSSTPLVTQPFIVKTTESQPHEVSCNTVNGILTLCNLQKTQDKGRRWVKRSTSIKSDLDVPSDLLQEDAENLELLRIQKRGGKLAICTISRYFGEKLQTTIPILWECCINNLVTVSQQTIQTDNEAKAQELVNSLQVLEVASSSFHSSLLPQVTDKLPLLCLCLQHKYTAIRYMASQCIATLCQLQIHSTMQFVVEDILPMLECTDSHIQRQGSIEAISNIIGLLHIDILPYIVLLVVPVLGRMCDQNESVRLMATHSFANMIRLLPLEAGIPDPPEMNKELVLRKVKERKFLEQLLDGSKLESYKITVDIKAELRKYQQDGVNWLGFLNRYKLHGILCDDMGLGKTLQSICILATDHYERHNKHQETGSSDSSPLPSIVVCPPTLVGHWVYEVNKFIDKTFLDPLMYAGPPTERIRLQKKFKKHNLIVASYDVVRNDIDFFTTFHWNYCILDEGHIIRNGKTKLSKAVKQLLCNHRLILSGTPIQNNVLDLWSLFDFLMPGFLGTEKQFQARYGKPILQSRDGKSTTKDQEAGALAMETLHRQVLPFILRRLKEDVLQDLPPKIIQDYYCDLSPIQVELYEDFAKSRAKNDIEDTVSSDEEKKSHGSTHIFQALQYLRKVCNHPSLVLTTSHPKYEVIMKRLKDEKSSLTDIHHAPKLTALKQLLNDCGIGVSTGNVLGTEEPVVNQHRVLLFCQLKSMLAIVEKDLLKNQMPSVTYLRLDGSVPAGSRHDIVHRFNNDPSIDILLLTTHVGGLGLNLTGADTVIFVEHDWNPMKDLQAMDRAHRIGQKKVVNVYRLITRGTLEEKIMGLQKFKINIANTIISQDNSNLQTMATDQLLDLFSLDNTKKGERSGPGSSGNEDNPKKESIKSILNSLEGMWDEPQYDTEYDLNNFMKSLNN